MPGGKRTRSLVWKKITHELVTTVAPVHPAFPHANGFNGFLRSLPGDRLFVSVVPGKRQLLKNLVPASGYQDATTSPSASRAIRQRRQSVHRIPRPTSVTIAKRPSVQGHGTAGVMDLIWAKREGIYFCSNDWTGSISLIGFEKFEVWRKGHFASRNHHLRTLGNGWVAAPNDRRMGR